MAREAWLIRGATVNDPALNTALTRDVWHAVCRSNRVSVVAKAATVTGTTPSLTLMLQVDLGGVWTDALDQGLTFTANDTTLRARVTRYLTRDDGVRLVATAKSGTTPGVTGLDLLVRCGE